MSLCIILYASCTFFSQNFFSHFKEGHRLVDYGKWMSATRPYEVTDVRYATCVCDETEKFILALQISWSPGAEPYLLVAREESPLYPQVLAERQQDKFPYMLELHLRR